MSKGVRLTENDVLSGLQILNTVTKEPKKTTSVELVNISGLTREKFHTLSQNGILECRIVRNNKRGRAFEWVWAGPKPNIQMAKRLMKTTHQKNADYRNSRVEVVEVSVEAEKIKAAVRSSVCVITEIHVKKVVNNTEVSLKVKQNDNNSVKLIDCPDNIIPLDALEAYGYAFLTASEEMKKRVYEGEES